MGAREYWAEPHNIIYCALQHNGRYPQGDALSTDIKRVGNYRLYQGYLIVK
jgi:hypothetical protein